ncbi:hypothetical protein CDD81_6317 [Ophiocordyceps australis]|uniref:Uncharacterized protein n=1 Tax=Ophiocordyceps australis TaxID=1399860 RepID=A0A2C5Y743_9HYPO|nr:hypothetical protein CDD81_6317 [Ophiocordyceps australis]
MSSQSWDFAIAALLSLLLLFRNVDAAPAIPWSGGPLHPLGSPTTSSGALSLGQAPALRWQQVAASVRSGRGGPMAQSLAGASASTSHSLTPQRPPRVLDIQLSKKFGNSLSKIGERPLVQPRVGSTGAGPLSMEPGPSKGEKSDAPQTDGPVPPPRMRHKGATPRPLPPRPVGDRSHLPLTSSHSTTPLGRASGSGTSRHEGAKSGLEAMASNAAGKLQSAGMVTTDALRLTAKKVLSPPAMAWHLAHKKFTSYDSD